MEAVMNHPDIDPSLLPGEPLNDSLDDGFSARVDDSQETELKPPARTIPADLTLNPKSLF
jgi:hypothetical protein